MPASYRTYASEIDPWLRASRGIGTLIAQRPYLAAQRSSMAQRQNLYDAQTGEATARGDLYKSQAGKFDAETQNLIKLGEAVTFLQAHGGEAEKALATGDVNNPIIDQVHGAMLAVSGQKGKDLSAQEKVQIGTMLAAKGQNYTAASVENPVAVNKTETDDVTKQNVADAGNATKLKIAASVAQNKLAIANLNKYRTGQPGSAIFDQQTGQVIERVPSASGFDTVTQTIPGTPGKDAVTHWFKPDEPAVPAVPKQVITRHVPRGTPTAVDAPTAVATPPPGAPVQTPDAAPVAQPAVPPAPAAVAPQLPDGSIVRHKATGQQFMVKGGQLVPLSPAPQAAPPPDSGD